MLDQYRRIKERYQGSVLFFRLGDFYEMFNEDALEISALLNLTLTRRNGLPMCGIPYHAVRGYIARLLRLGKKIALCEQVSDRAKGRAVMDREVVEVITPGTIIDEDFLDKGSSNYLAAMAAAEQTLSFAYIDLSTGDFFAAAFPLAGAVNRLRLELERLQIRELILQESLLEKQPALGGALADRPSLVVNRWGDWLFDLGRSRARLEQQFGSAALKGFGLRDHSLEMLAAGALLEYLADTAKGLIPHVRHISLYRDEEYVGIDESSQRNLELVRNLRDGSAAFSLLEVMDETKTAMGRRLLKRRLLHPLQDLERITRRLDMVETFYLDQNRLARVREVLGKIPDLERLCSRLGMDRAHGKDLGALKNALSRYQALEELIRETSVEFETDRETRNLEEPGLQRLFQLRDLLEAGMTEAPSILLTEGNLIREGYNEELDRLRRLKDNGRKLLEDYLEEEKEATGIPSLKIRYNRLIGYFFEITKAHLAKAPKHFIRRQGVVTGERFTTDKLAALESDINGAENRIAGLEKKLFLEIRDTAKSRIAELAVAARRVAEVDAAQCLARAAAVRGWVRPRVHHGKALRIWEGRHPVVESHLPRGEFIPNDLCLDAEGAFSLITGPNMAGKSTYLRQAALITIMTQMGSFVPAREAEIGLVDRIYCRVGASDNLARGESTFLMEMNETAYILHTATDQSLVIMDEVGRGTGTNDGLAIAWAVSEELLEHIQCRTLFATHYHELADITHPRLMNYSMEVREQDGKVVFFRKLKRGASAESYGIHVARLAGLPDRVLDRAARIMQTLNQRDRARLSGGPAAEAPDAAETADAAEADTTGGFETTGEAYRRYVEDMRALDPERMTPLEALDRLYQWKQLFGAACKPRASRKPQKNLEPGLFD
ncbi:MAG: DNA mismatch repair protein MutS [Treponema sp.]|jgi:DNA mismatch repair protein MutS|nr:DNA mismatch repair protein MutS [Treponema sp.]